MLPGETSGRAPSVTCECGEVLPLAVCHSAAGHYLGYGCGSCGPYGRETSYYMSFEEANTDLERHNNGEVITTWRS